MPALEVSICSLVSNISSEYQYNIYILYNSEDGPLRTDCFNAILDYKQENIDIQFIGMTSSYCHGLFKKTIPYISKASLYFLFIDDYINKDKILYLDSDTIINQDISTLYNEDINNYLFGAVLDTGVNQSYIKNIVKEDLLYFNAGVLLINLDLYKQQKIQSKSLHLIKEMFFLYQDQDVLNQLAEGQVKYLPPRYNMQWAPLFFSDRPAELYLSNEFDELTEEDWNNPYIIHYNGIHKPWRNDRDHKYAIYWWNYANQTKFYGGK